MCCRRQKVVKDNIEILNGDFESQNLEYVIRKESRIDKI